jgi:ankyrin repeat protein
MRPFLIRLLGLILVNWSAVLGAGAGTPPETDQQLIAAAMRGEVTTVQTLLASGANVGARDEHGWTALMAATHANQVGAAALLVAAGSDVNAKDNLQDSPYLYAGAEGRLEILKITLVAGADLKSTNRFGGTALIPACEKGHLENVKVLLQTKIDVNHVNRLGWTALMETAMKKGRGPVHTEIARRLLAAGADPSLPDHQGVTPLTHAEQAGNREIAALLRAAGGK